MKLRRTVALTAAVLGGLAMVTSTNGPISALDEVDPDLPATTAGLNRFGSQLLEQLVAGDPSGNLVFSPLSVQVAMAMAGAGASGATAEEIDTVLGLDEVTDPSVSVRGLLAAVDASGDGSVHFANSLWVQDGFGLHEGYVEQLAGLFLAEAGNVDFLGDPEGAVAAVNQWVSDNTGGRIPSLLSPQQINELTRLILVNTVFLDAEWASPFEFENTFDRPFAAPTGPVDAPFMHQTLTTGYAQGADGTQAVTLPYTSGLEMVIVLPADDGVDGLADFEAALVAADGDLTAVLGPSTDTEVILSLPKWDIETDVELGDPLQQLGIELAFTGDADFSGITDETELQIGDVIHQANITVDELGTEAAAATAVLMEAGSAAPDDGPQPVPFVADRPFHYLVRDSVTGAVIFEGRITNPSA